MILIDLSSSVKLFWKNWSQMLILPITFFFPDESTIQNFYWEKPLHIQMTTKSHWLVWHYNWKKHILLKEIYTQNDIYYYCKSILFQCFNDCSRTIIILIYCQNEYGLNMMGLLNILDVPYNNIQTKFLLVKEFVELGKFTDQGIGKRLLVGLERKVINCMLSKTFSSTTWEFHTSSYNNLMSFFISERHLLLFYTFSMCGTIIFRRNFFWYWTHIATWYWFRFATQIGISIWLKYRCFHLKPFTYKSILFQGSIVSYLYANRNNQNKKQETEDTL